MRKIIILFFLFIISSCSFLNEKHVHVGIKSNPSGAEVYIDGQYFGQTPARVKLVPDKNYKATIVKRGYGSSNLDLETWASVRGGRGADTTRCVLDSISFFFFWAAYKNCRDFKQTEYTVNIGNNDFSSNSNINLQMIKRPNNQQDYNRQNYQNSSNNNLYNDNYNWGNQNQNSSQQQNQYYNNQYSGR